jgi:hypothetical protein
VGFLIVNKNADHESRNRHCCERACSLSESVNLAQKT